MHLKAIRKIRALLSLSRRTRALEANFSDLQTQLDQFVSLATVRSPVPRMPPKHLQVRVAGIYNSSFYSSGQQQVHDIEAFLQSNGKSFQDFETILDFGCGCGRTLIPLSQFVPSERIYGTDIDGEAIDWLKTHHGSFKDLDVNGIEPPTKYADEAARVRYETLIVAAIRDIAEDPDRPGSPVRPELGVGARSWHFRLSRSRAREESGPVRRPRHLIVFRIGDGGIIGIGRVLHDAMELERHRPMARDWD